MLKNNDHSLALKTQTLFDKIENQFCTQFKKEIKEYNKQKLDPSSFEDLISWLKKYTGYDHLSLILHKKGDKNATVFSSGVIMTSTQFDNYFQIIKKSRKKLFTVSAKSFYELDFLGSFLAEVIVEENFKAILILSRNEFLPHESDEIKYIKKIAEMIHDTVAHIIKKNKGNFEKNILEQFFNEYPYYVTAQTLDQMLVLGNKKMTGKDRELIFSENLSDIEMSVYAPRDQGDLGQAFHHERIKLLGELLDTLRHELVNPLFGIKLSSEILKNTTQDLEQSYFIENVLTAANHCEFVLQSFSAMYLDNVNQQINFHECISEALSLAKSETKGIQIVCHEISNNDSHIVGNKNFLVQVFFNLIINSAQALEGQKAPKIEIKELIHENSIELYFSDNGPGVPKDIIQNLFKPFYTTKQKGTGLGLSISKNFLKNMKGELKYIKKKNGAHFQVSFQR